MTACAGRLLAAALLAGVALAAGSAASRAAIPGSSVTFIVSAPASTPAGDTLWLSGDRPELGAWNGAGLRLVRGADGAWWATLPAVAGTAFEYKLTRGAWETVEKDARGGELANRRWTASGGADTVRLEVATWRDQGEGAASPRVHTITGTVRRHPAFPSHFVPARDILVWLPPGYEVQTTRRYPVVYFQDGQNVLDGATSFLPGQEWGADEAADALIRAGKLPPCILVAVSNTSARMDEYTSAADSRHGGGHSDAYRRFLGAELKPFIDSTYRTRPEGAHTAVIGSSLGALVSLDLGLADPKRFGLVGCISPAAWWADTEIVRRVRAGAGHPVRVWLDIGTVEDRPAADGSRPWIDHARALRNAMLARGWREGVDLHYEEVEGAAHNERAWAARVGRILEFLLAGS